MLQHNRNFFRIIYANFIKEDLLMSYVSEQLEYTDEPYVNEEDDEKEE